MSDEPLTEIAAAQKKELLQREAYTQGEIVRVFGAVYHRIQDLVDAIQREIKEKFNGEKPPLSFLNERDRLLELRKDIERALRTFATNAGEKISADQRLALARGAGDAESLLEATRLAPNALTGAAVAKDLSHLVGLSGDGSALSLLFEKMGPVVARAVAEELTIGVGEGAAPQVVAARIRERAGIALTRSLLIARQETLRVYREAALETFSRSTGVIMWRWLATLDVRSCAVCWAMDGKTFPLTVRFSSHVGCRCSMVPVAIGSPGPARTGAEAFKQLEPGVQQQILGPQKFNLYRAGRLQLDQVVGVRHSAQWGLVRYERTAKELMRELGRS